MKTPLFFLAALVAFFVLPIDFATMTSVLFAAGLATILVADYRRTYRAVTPSRVMRTSGSHEPLRLAA